MNEYIQPLRVTCLGRYAKTPLSLGGDDTLIRKLLEHDISEAESLEKSDVVVMCEFLEKDLKQLERIEFPLARRVLLLMEPEVVLPSHHGKKMSENFGTTLKVGRSPVASTQSINWPQIWRKLPELALPRDIDKIVMIAGNKLSFIPGELYGLRRTCAFKLPELALFGSQWDNNISVRFRKMIVEILRTVRGGYVPRLKSARFWLKRNSKWLGAPGDKQKTLKQFRYSLVIENSSEFLSEKLFDAFFAGCIPIYVGPDVKDYGIPSSLVVSVGSDLSSIRNGILEAKKINYASWYAELDAWLGDSRTVEAWSMESYFEQLAETLKEIHSRDST